jgi:hypothetical protein
VLFTEIVRESGNTENFKWPLKSGGGMGTLYYEYIQLTQSGYYNFYYSFILSTNATIRARFNVRNTITGAVIDFDETTATTLGGTQQFGNWTKYIEANQIVSFTLTPTTTVGLWPGNKQQSPVLTITQIAQFTDTTVGKHTRLYRNALGNIVTATSTIVSYDTILPSGQNRSNVEANQGGGNQLRLIAWGATPTTMVVKKTSTYLITASVEWANAANNAGVRAIGIYNITTAVVLAQQNVDANSTAPAQNRKCNVSTVVSCAAGDNIAIYLYQNSGITISIVVGGITNFTMMDLGSDD